MKIKKIPIKKILNDSFNFLFFDFLEKSKKGFFIVFLITLAFNGLSFLISNSLATNFTIFLFIVFSMLLMSSVGICVHKEIIANQKQDFFLEFLSIKNFKYCLSILLIILIAISPFLIIHSLVKVFNISFLFLFLMITFALAFKLIFILPKIALDIKLKKISKELNNIGFQLFVLFFIVTMIFFIPSVILVSFQVSLLATNSQIFSILKPFFDLVTFYISYFNYLIIFAVISYSYKISKSK